MAKAGLSFQSPTLQNMGYSVEDALDPYRYYNPTASIGTGGLQPSLADMAVTGQQLVEQTEFTMPSMRTPARPEQPSVGIDPASGDLFVQGRRFSQEDAATALETEPLLDQPPTGLPEGFRAISPQAYRGFLQTIKDPERGRLFSKNVDIGLANLKQIGGAALAFGGAEETGARLMESAKERLRQLQPFQRTFTEIEDTDEFGDWFVANFAQQVPNILESVAAALGGAAAGTLIGGPAGTVGGFFGGLLAKSGVKNALTLAAKKKAEGIALDAAERKLLNQAGGAVAATLGSSYIFGVGDIYGEQLESGAPNRIGAALSAIPYAAADSLGELFIGSRVLGGAGGRALRDIPTTRGKAGELLKRGTIGAGVGGALEGTTEAFQETLVIANNPEVDIDSPEAINRLINSFAAGAAVGAPLGGAGNIVAKRPQISPDQETDILNPDEEPNAASQELSTDPDTPVDETIPIVTGIPGVGAGREQGVLNLFTDLPTEGPEALTQAELLDRMQPVEVGELRPPVAGLLEVRPELQIIPPVTPATEVSPQQGVLQFAEPPPPDQFGIEQGRTALRTALGEALARQRDMQLMAEEQQKAEAKRQAELAEMQRDATTARQLQILEDAEAAELTAQRPAPVEGVSAPFVERGPEQLPLDLRRGRLSKAQKKKGAKQLRKSLREEAARAEAEVEPEVTRASRREFLTTARQAGQLPLFTQRGEPSAVAEGRPRAPRTPRPAPVAPTVDEQLREQFALLPAEEAPVVTPKVTPVTEVTPEVTPTQEVTTDATQEGKQSKGRKLKRKRDDAVVQEDGQVGVEPTQVQREGTEAGRGDRLKQGRKVTEKVVQKIPRKREEPAPAPAPTPTLEQEVAQIVEDWSDAQILDASIETAETTRNTNEYELAILNIMEYAYTPDSNMRKQGLDTKAVEFLNEIPRDDTFKDVLLRLVRVQDSFAAAQERGENKGKLTPLFQAIVDAGVFKEAKRLATIRNLPAEYAEGGVSAPKTTKDKKVDDARNNNEKILADLISEVNGRTTNIPKAQRTQIIEKLTDLYYAVEFPEFTTASGKPLSDYFTADGEPKTQIVNNKLRIVTNVLTEEEIRKAERDARIDIEALRAIEDDTLTLDDWNMYGIDVVPDEDLGDGRFFTDDGAPIRKSLPVGRIKMTVASFVKKLAKAPKVYTYKNQEDFQRRNPQLYAQAVAARPQGDFDTAPAVGYSFGKDNVVIFTDRVLTERQLKFVLAHETLGHYGFRGLMSERQLNAALDKIYNESQYIRDLADQAAEARNISKVEATEEVLADMAGSLDTNVIARFWNLIKNALNKVGIKFEDDYARYLISQSRRYVRNGNISGQMFIPSEVGATLQSIERMEDPMGSGRYSTEHYDSLGRIAGAMNNMGENGGITGTAEFFEQLKKYKTNAADFGEKVLSELKTMNFSARDNFGYRELFKILRDTVQKVNVLRNKYNHMMATALRPTGELFGFTFGEGATKEEIDQASEMLTVTSRVKLPELTEAMLKDLPDLVVIVNGEARINQEAFNSLSEMGKFTIDDFRKGIKYKIRVPRAMDDEGRAQIIAERDAELAGVTDPKEIESINKEYEVLLNADSYSAVVDQEFPAIPDLTEDSNVWKMYNEVRDTMDQSAIDMLLANYAAASGERAKVQTNIEGIIGRKLTEGDKAFLQIVEDKFLELRNENSSVDSKGVVVFNQASVDNADAFMAAFNSAIIGKDTDRNTAVVEYFDADQRDDVSASINEFKQDITISSQNRFQIQQDIQNLALFELSKLDAERYAKRSIAGSYVPFGREGAWQVRMQAYDPNTGQVYKIAEQWRQSLPYYQVENRYEAEALASRVTDLFDIEDGVKLQVLVDGEYKVMPVVLRAEAETSRQEVSVNTETNLNEVVSILNRFKVQITPKERERLVTGLTAQNAKARTRLERAGTPGEDKNIVKYVSQHLESTASTVARKENRHRLDTLFDESNSNSNKLWFGDEATYNRLKENYERLRDDDQASEQAKQSAKRAYEDYHYVFKTKQSKEFGNRFRDRAIRSVAFLESQRSIEYSDFGSGDAASRLKMATVFAQLGGSFATAVLNLVALTTNVLPVMSSYNAKNGFGGGFGYGESATGLVNAMSQLAGPDKADSDYYSKLLQDNDALNASGLSREDAQFLYDQTSAGTFQAALFNSLLGSARGKVTSGAAQKAIQTWMGMFSYTEQLSRRATGLAAFRKFYARAIAEGKPAEQAYTEATDATVDLVEQTLGEYAMFNRPSFFRGDVRQFIFMYKMFVVTSVQMLSAMDRKGQLLMVGTLMLMSGVKGLPFADDLFDLIDTIAQLLGLNISSAEAELAKTLDAIAPGMTPVLMRGIFDQLLPATISSRVSLGDMIPGTGIALAGSDLGRELINIAGPAASFIQGSLAFTTDSVKWGLSQVGLVPETTSFTTILRESPVTILRALGDSMSYADSGAVTNRKGYVVSPDMTTGTILSRLLGFYPSAATRENDVIRLSKRIADYGRDIKASYNAAYVKARIEGDSRRANQIVRAVQEWNKSAKGTGLEIKDFVASANRSLREARRSATGRYLKTAPKNVRPESEALLRLYGVE